MIVADNDNHAMLRVMTDEATTHRVEALKTLVGAEDDIEFLELALEAHEQFGSDGPGDSITPSPRTGSVLAFRLSPGLLATLDAACLKSGDTRSTLVAKALHSFIGCCNAIQTASVSGLRT